MNITHMTYARVAADATPRFPRFRPIEDDVMGFLGGHVDSLCTMAKAPDATPPGRFARRDAQRLFRELHTGSDDEFLAAADALTKRLVARMNRTTAEGLLVCLRAETATEGRVAGALKLQVVAPNAAVLRALDSGELVLTAVKDLPDSPGELQKGALVVSSLPDGQIICGDRVAHIARYFPEAFDIQICCRPSVATKAFFDAVEEFAGSLISEVAAAWPTLRPGSPRAVLAELGQKVPGLTATLRADIAERLETAVRPVARLDTTRVVKETYQAGQITISGPVEEMRRHVRIALRPEHDGDTDGNGSGGWRVTVDSADRPASGHH